MRVLDPTALFVRPMRAGDEVHAQALVARTSRRSRYLRFFGPMNALDERMLARLASFEPGATVTLLAWVIDVDVEAAARGEPAALPREHVVGIAEYVVESYPRRADFALLVDDDWQHRRVGTRLIRELACMARAAGIERLEGDVLAENRAMLALLLREGYEIGPMPGDATIRHATLALAPARPCAAIRDEARASARATRETQPAFG